MGPMIPKEMKYNLHYGTVENPEGIMAARSDPTIVHKLWTRFFVTRVIYKLLFYV